MVHFCQTFDPKKSESLQGLKMKHQTGCWHQRNSACLNINSHTDRFNRSSRRTDGWDFPSKSSFAPYQHHEESNNSMLLCHKMNVSGKIAAGMCARVDRFLPAVHIWPG